MFAATFDTRRRELGLSQIEIAAVIGVTDRRVRDWINEGLSPRDPAGVLARLDEVEIAMGDFVDHERERIVEAIAASGERHAVLARYRSQAALDLATVSFGLPLGAHAMAIAWLADDLRSDGVTVGIDWAD